MMPRQIKSLTLFLLFLFPTILQALPERYAVIASETPRDFYFFEDQPWVNPPKKIRFSSKLASQKVIVLHLWATSCPTCVPELQQLEQTAKDYRDQPIDFIVLSLNDPRSGVLRNFFNRSRYTHLKPYHNPSGARPPIKGLPTTLFFNKNGKLIGRLEGAGKWQSNEMKRLLNRLITEEIKQDPAPSGFFTSYFKRISKWFS